MNTESLVEHEEIKKLRNYRIFHIGNIANNAFNSAYFEREIGLNSFAISPNYTHIMGFPCWELDDLVVDVENHFSPSKFLTKKFLPKWFLWGSWQSISLQLESLREQNHLQLRVSNPINSKKLRIYIATRIEQFRVEYAARLKKFFPKKMRRYLQEVISKKIRQFQMLETNINFEKNDLVVFYGPSNALSFELHCTDFVSLEHGTLRDWVHSDASMARDSKNAFLNSAAVLITNQDCYEIAIKMGIPENQLIKTPHPSLDFDFANLRKTRKSKLVNREINKRIIYPARHSLPTDNDAGKGNDKVLRAFARIVKEHPEMILEMFEWGNDVDYSKKLIKNLGIENNIEWSSVVSRKMLKKRMSDCMVVIDQFNVDAFGAIVHDALGLGVPVISRQDIQLDTSFFGEAPPILAAKTENQIFGRILEVLESRYELGPFENSTHWFDRHLSPSIAFQARLNAYKVLIQRGANER